MGGQSLQQCTEIEDLGITNSTFSFAIHIENKVKSVNKMLGFIIIQSHFNTLKLLYYSFVRRKLEFGSLFGSRNLKVI